MNAPKIQAVPSASPAAAEGRRTRLITVETIAAAPLMVIGGLHPLDVIACEFSADRLRELDIRYGSRTDA